MSSTFDFHTDVKVIINQEITIRDTYAKSVSCTAEIIPLEHFYYPLGNTNAWHLQAVALKISLSLGDSSTQEYSKGSRIYMLSSGGAGCHMSVIFANSLCIKMDSMWLCSSVWPRIISHICGLVWLYCSRWGSHPA